MKIQILQKIEDSIDGFTPILIDDGNFEIDVPKNSIESILMIDSLEKIKYENLYDTLLKITNLLRLNGELILGGVDIECLSRDLLAGKLSVDEYNQIVFSKNNLCSSYELTEKLKKLGLKINKVTVKGAVYEIQASRSN